jgi:hypothetical protein
MMGYIPESMITQSLKGLLLGTSLYCVACSGSTFAPGADTGGASSSSGGITATGGSESIVGGQTALGSGGSANATSSSTGGAITVGGTSGAATQPLGGTASTGGSRANGGATGTGGTTSTGGSKANGGAAGTGGTASTGGSKVNGGTTSSGGNLATGGSRPTGGTTSTGGSLSTGGSQPTGGTTSTGGSLSTGGSGPSGGTTNAGGTLSTGGSLNTGGSPATGGSLGTGGSSASFDTITFGERENSTFNYVTNDTDLLSSTPTYNYGYAQDFGCNASPLRVGIVRFDTNAFAGVYGHGRAVLAARLHLWTMPCSGCQASPGTVVRIFGMQQFWQEVANNSAQGDGGIPNWTQADIDTSSGSAVNVDWAAAGAQPPARGTTELANFSPTAADTDYVVSLPAGVVQAWLDGPAANYGLTLVISGSTPDFVTFQASDGDSTKAPLLEVDLAN